MAEVQSQPAAIPESKLRSLSSDKDALISRLDELLEQYLHTLDEYHKAREQVSKQLSSGYFSLAQANFQNRSTTHYGQDSYDERMQAIRTVNVTGDQSTPEESGLHFSISPKDQHSASTKDQKEETSQPNASESQQQPSEKHEPEPGSPSPEANDTKGNSKAINKTNDPIRWFGILVPPALRSAQQSFISVVEGPIPQLATIARDLRSQEIEIGRVRKQIKRL